MDKQLVRLSKFLSLVLRHKPGQIGVTLDAQGWLDVDTLLAAAKAQGVALDRPTLESFSPCAPAR
jgi:putative RNA 2'-phosphotransferase